MSTLEKIDIDDYWSIINYNYDQIRFAEIKASAVISVHSLILTLAYTFDVLDEENIYDLSSTDNLILKLIIFLPGVFFTLNSLKDCISCILPRLKIIVDRSPLFFGSIESYKDFENYFQDLERVLGDENEYRKNLTQSVYATAKIANSKFLSVNKAIKSLIYSVLSYTIFLIVFLAV